MAKVLCWFVGLCTVVSLAVACGDDEGGGDRPTDGGEAGAGGAGAEAGSGEPPNGGSGGDPSAAGGVGADGGVGGTSAGSDGAGASGGEVAGSPSAGGTDGGSAMTGGQASGGEPGGAGADCTGTESCACYPNDTCNAGLACLSGVCVSDGEGGSPGAGGSAGEGGVPATTGGTAGEGGAAGSGGEGNTGLPFTNGWFLDGTTGWTVTGGLAGITDAPTMGNFQLYGMKQLTTYAPDDANLVVISQTFDVPDDALALRFAIWGGDEGVQLLDDAGEELEGIFGPGNNDYSFVVSWDLDGLRGERVEFRITDDSTVVFGSASISGIDLIRDVPSAISNHEFRDGSLNWTPSDGALSWDYSLDPSTNRYSMSSFALVGGSLGVASVGELQQSFVVPDDALALRFWVSGGTDADLGIELRANAPPSGGILEPTVRGAGDGLVPVSWDLTPYRGDTLYLYIYDGAAASYIATTGFDLITSTNGQ